MKRLLDCLMLTALAATPVAAQAANEVLNLYTARHYQVDEALYKNFETATGIKINRIEGSEDPLLERIRNEGANSPADVFITVDASRLAKADELGIFAPLKSATLEARIPAHLRTATWVAFSTRARVIVYNKATFNPTQIQNYEDLAKPELKGKICIRSGAHPYNLSLGASMIAHVGKDAAEAWAKGLAGNLAREPKGGDTDQLKAVAAGECAVAVSNTYYVARLMRSDKADERKVAEALGVIWPNQQNRGTHINISGGGILKNAPNKEAAIKFLEYLASDQAQIFFADANNEWPTVPSVKIKNPALDALGLFKSDSLKIGNLSQLAAEAQKMYDRVGFR